jgi:C4-dicarboxylate-specific signal transduction histidine kinase
MFKKLSYAKKIFIILMGTSVVITLTATLISILFSIENGERAFEDKIKSITYMLAESSTSALDFNAPEILDDTLLTVAGIAKLDHIVIYNHNGELFTEHNPQKLALPLLNGHEHLHMEYESVEFHSPVVYEERIIGTVYIRADLSNFRNAMFDKVTLLGLFFLLLLVVVFFISKKMQKVLSQPILSLAKSAQSIKNEHNFSIRVNTTQKSEEIVILYDAFNDMLSKMQEREQERDIAEEQTRLYQEHLETLTQELEERVELRTSDLQESMKELEATQDQLVESEKMASLGTLVGGVAHEVNTPLGNAITVLSVLHETASELQESLETNQLKKSVLVEKLSLLEDSAGIIETNVKRAADLIKSFKKISIDQISDDERVFEIAAYSNEIFVTFKSVLKKQNVGFNISMYADKKVKSYPGIYAQIISNLIQNTLMHAFEGVSEPHISLSIEVIEQEVTLLFRDNGRGIDQSVMSTIFEPFVTTKRNQGGSGLGLNIVYNLVTQKLHGTIKVSNHPEGGAEFKIQFKVEEV